MSVSRAKRLNWLNSNFRPYRGYCPLVTAVEFGGLSSLHCLTIWWVFFIQNVEQIVRFLKVQKYSPRKTRFLHLKPCGHVVEVSYMDEWVASSTPTPPSSPQYVTCPTCKQMVGLCPRYTTTATSTITSTTLRLLTDILAEITAG